MEVENGERGNESLLAGPEGGPPMSMSKMEMDVFVW
jgi:hypothetical protein